jgi:hypothetical protein
MTTYNVLFIIFMQIAIEACGSILLHIVHCVKVFSKFQPLYFRDRPLRNFVLLSFALLHVLPQCHRDFMRLKKGHDKSDDIAKPFVKLPSLGSLLLLCELTHIVTCDTSNIGNFCKNL